MVRANGFAMTAGSIQLEAPGIVRRRESATAFCVCGSINTRRLNKMQGCKPAVRLQVPKHHTAVF